MNKSNFALITALYDTQTSELYKDIYFPAIKYGLFLLYKEQVDIQKYYTLENIQEIINNQFGVPIPLIVIKQAMKLIHSAHPDFSIQFLSNGDQFSIKKVWDVSITESIDNKYDQNVKAFITLEKLFADYLSIQHIETDKTFLSFFADNTEEIFNYINGDNQSPLINEEYIHIINFLKWLQTANTDIYNIASDIFWGSVIAAFLRRDTDIQVKPETQVLYYLDSSLILSLLDLDSDANHQYCTELIKIIKASGNLPYVHPLTIREINSILYSVERDQVPRPNSGIADAYYRRNLTPSKILQIRQGLRTLIEKLVYIDNMPETKVDEILLQYKGKLSVRALADTRKTQYSDNIRDIHDVYMIDFIHQKQNKAISIEKCNAYFVSLNSDLKTLHPHNNQNSPHPIIHPSRIVMDLWIHNSKTTIVRKDALTEVIARCTALNQTDVQRKLRLVSKYYRTEEFTTEKYNAVFLALANRSKQVINQSLYISNCDTNNMSDSEVEKAKEYAQNIVKLSQEFYSGMNAANIELHTKLEELKELTKSQVEAIDQREKKLSEREHIHNELNSNSECISKYQDELISIKDDIHKLEIERNSNVNMWLYWMSLIVQILCVLMIVIALIIYRFKLNLNWETIKTEIYDNPGWLIGCAFSLIGLLVSGFFKLSIFTPCKAYKQHKSKLMQDWENSRFEYPAKLSRCKELKTLISQHKKNIENLRANS